jgi:hypothetical protein
MDFIRRLVNGLKFRGATGVATYFMNGILVEVQPCKLKKHTLRFTHEHHAKTWVGAFG